MFIDRQINKNFKITFLSKNALHQIENVNRIYMLFEFSYSAFRSLDIQLLMKKMLPVFELAMETISKMAKYRYFHDRNILVV